MKVLFLTNSYPDFDNSNRGIFIKRLAELLFMRGHEIAVVTPKIYQRSHYFENKNGISIYRFPFFARNKLLIEHPRIPYGKMILYFISGFSITLYVVLKHKCELIHVHWAIPTGLIGFLIGTFLKKPLIITIHGSDLRMANEKRGLLKKMFISICKNASHIHCVSEVQRREIEGLSFFQKKITVFPMGIDEVFINSNLKRDEIMPNHSITVVSNRNLIAIYNVYLLIRAIPSVLKEEPETKFIIAGDGSEKERLEREVEQLKIKEAVKFFGRIPHHAMPDLLSQSDIYVSTSLYDGTSVSLLEAMASGCFPIVSDIPSNREWIRDGENGFLFPVNDENILAQKILLAIRNKSLREKSRGENLRIIKEKALWSVCIEKIKGIYEAQLSRSTH